MTKSKKPIQPVSGTEVPRYAGPSTFARLPELRDVDCLLYTSDAADE